MSVRGVPQSKLFGGLDTDKIYHLWATTVMHPSLIARRIGSKDPYRVGRIIAQGRAVNNPQILKGDALREKEGVGKNSRY